VVEGCTIRYLVGARQALPPLVLVHGGAAHANWWSHLAPLLADTHRVVALDLSGHGESGWRETYRPELWADEVLAVADAAGSESDGATRRGRALDGGVRDHRRGGAARCVARGGHRPRRPRPTSGPRVRGGETAGPNMFRAPKTYPDLDTAVAHFHLVPPQPATHPWLLDHVARQSLRSTPDGWTWKFDPRMFAHRSGPSRPSEFGPELARAACRLAVVNGERSAIVDDDVIAHMQELVAGSPASAAGVPFVKVPDAHHHLLLDQPLATVTALQSHPRHLASRRRRAFRRPSPGPRPGDGTRARYSLRRWTSSTE
jgi:pimeloyl-ACP methyl ester carboxylesterase